MRYAVVFETDGTGIMGGVGSADEFGTEEVLRSMVAKALNEATSLPVDMLSLTFEPGTQNQYDRYEVSMRTTTI